MSSSTASTSNDELRRSRQMAEESRQKTWAKPSFLRDLAMGRFHFERICPYPGVGRPERPEYEALMASLRSYLLQELDPIAIDEAGEFPEDVIERLAEIGALGLNIPTAYEGQGLSKLEYCRVLELTNSYEGSLMGFISPHQSVGVPECVKLFGTEAQKAHYLPRCAKGDVSAFALTELDVGSDPARVSTLAVRRPDGDGYDLSGTKLWCTNGTVAKLLVVMARHDDTGKISAFIVETEWPGVEVTQRCRFMGLSALQNGVIQFDKVFVPKDNLIGSEGMGLRIALTALTTGRLSIPYGMVGVAKKCLEVSKTWAAQRKQWGKALGEHEAIALKLARMASNTWAMESAIKLTCEIADRGDLDLRLESAAAKEWNTSRAWEIVDDTMQIRGGRGYEKESSLMARGETPMPVERLMRDNRVARIFEGASEVMHLLIAREAVDQHLQVAGAWVEEDAPLGARLKALPRLIKFYGAWFPRLWFSNGVRPEGGIPEGCEAHFNYIERNARRAARQLFYGMLRYGASLEFRQGFLFRWVDIILELFVLSAALSRAITLDRAGDAHAREVQALTNTLFENRRQLIEDLFRALWSNADTVNRTTAQQVLEGRFDWMLDGILTLEDEARGRSLREEAETPGGYTVRS